MSFVNFLAAAATGVTPPPAGLVSLIDTISATTYPFQNYGPVALSRDGYTAFAIGNDAGVMALWVWRWNGTNWPNLQVVRITTTTDDDGIGSGSPAYIYCRLRANNDGSKVFLSIFNADSNKGVVYVYSETTTNTWSVLQRIANPTGTADAFGYSLACDDSGDRFVVGAPFYDPGTFDGSGNPQRGKLYWYVLSAGSYSVEDSHVATHGDIGGSGLGVFAAMSGDGFTTVSGDNDYDDSFIGVGNLESYTRSGSSWSFGNRVGVAIDALDNYFSQASLGIRLTSDGSSVYVPADVYDRIVVYSISGGTMTYDTTHVGPLDFTITGDFDDCYSTPKFMGMSDDGAIFEVGDHTYDGSVLNGGRVSRWVSGAYTSAQTVSPVINFDLSGAGVDLSADGSIVLWSAPNTSAVGFGADRIFAKVY